MIFRFGNRTNYSEPPDLIPVGSNRNVTVNPSSPNFILNGATSYSVIDVRNDFNWTNSPKSSKVTTPYIVLNEKKLLTNSLIAQALYNTGAAATTLQNGLGNPALANSKFFGAATGAATGGIVKEMLQKALGSDKEGSSMLDTVFNLFGAGAGAGAGAAGAATFISSSLTNLVGGITDIFAPGVTEQGEILDGVMSSYNGLYLLASTGFNYAMPYFNNSQQSIKNTFDDSDSVFEGAGATKALVPAIQGVAEMFAATRNFAQGLSKTFFLGAPGIYIEKPKYYNFKSSGERITINFPLINTGWATYEDVIKNWELIFLLTYQNLPRRRSRDLIDPPALYTASIPGIGFHPYCFISKFTVEFKGNRRKYLIDIPGLDGGSSSQINTIIPEAYELEIELTTLINESQNSLYYMLERNDEISINNNQGGGALPTGQSKSAASLFPSGPGFSPDQIPGGFVV